MEEEGTTNWRRRRGHELEEAEGVAVCWRGEEGD
jgi:hypothetical protein